MGKRKQGAAAGQKVAAAVPKRVGQTATPELVAKGLVVDGGESEEGVRRQRTTSWPPDRLYYDYRTIDEYQFEACYRFARDFQRAGLMPRASFSLSPSSGGGRSDRMTAAVLEALVEWGDAYRAIGGVSPRRIAVDVICSGYTPAELMRPPSPGEVMQFTRLEREKIFRGRKEVMAGLLQAVYDLQRHYGLPIEHKT